MDMARIVVQRKQQEGSLNHQYPPQINKMEKPSAAYRIPLSGARPKGFLYV
jgi:hypothetical protein